MAAGVAYRDGAYWLFSADGLPIEKVTWDGKRFRDGAGFLIDPPADASPAISTLAAEADRYVTDPSIPTEEFLERVEEVKL